MATGEFLASARATTTGYTPASWRVRWARFVAEAMRWCRSTMSLPSSMALSMTSVAGGVTGASSSPGMSLACCWECRRCPCATAGAGVPHRQAAGVPSRRRLSQSLAQPLWHDAARGRLACCCLSRPPRRVVSGATPGKFLVDTLTSHTLAADYFVRHGDLDIAEDPPRTRRFRCGGQPRCDGRRATSAGSAFSRSSCSHRTSPTPPRAKHQLAA